MTKLRVSLIVLLIAAAYLYRLDRPLLWGDEAGTGVVSRNVLRSGFPKIDDGRNITIPDNGARISRRFLVTQVSWLQYYVGAASIAVFGDSTGGLRFLFAVIGLAAFFPIRAVLKRHVKYPEIVAAIAMLSPQALLFQRNARYYSLLIFLYALLVWDIYRSREEDRDAAKKNTQDEANGNTQSLLSGTVPHAPGNQLRISDTKGSGALTTLKLLTPRQGLTPSRLWVPIAIFVLLFHTHSFAAACCGLSLLIYCYLFQRRQFLLYLIAAGTGFATWVLWTLILGPAITPDTLWIAKFKLAPAKWALLSLQGFFLNLLDLDVVGCLPLILLAALIAFLIRKRKSLSVSFRQPLPAFIAINIAVQAFVTAGIFGTEAVERFALLRYMPHLCLFGLLSVFVLLNKAIPRAGLSLVACALIVALNAFSLAYWTKPLQRKPPLSWCPPVYSEIVNPQADAWDTIIRRMSESSYGDGNHVAFVVPPWDQEILIYYLGDRYLIFPFESGKPSVGRDLKEAVLEKIGRDRYDRLLARPEWIIDVLAIGNAPAGYEAESIPWHVAVPDDGGRPELTRHSFRQPQPSANANLLHREP